MGRIWVLLGTMAVAGLGGWALRGWMAPSSAGSGAEANTCRAARGHLEQHIKARGIVKPAPNSLVRVGFPFPKDLARRIGHLQVVEGDVVSPQAELAQLEHEDLKASKAQLQAELEVFERRLAALKVLEPVETRLAEAVLAERTAQLGYAQRIHDRKLKLVKTSAVSTEEWETAASDLAVAKARQGQAEASLQQTRDKFCTDIKILEAQLSQARAAIEAVQVQIDWSTLRSPWPVPAQVFAVHQRQGELTSGQPNVPVLTLLDPNQLQVHLFVDETDFGHIGLSQQVTLRLESHPDVTVKGRIARVLPQPILQENVVYYLAMVEVVPEQRSLLRAEMTVLGHVQVGVKESVVWLPLGAVRSRPDGWYVARPSRAGPVETPVRIGWKDRGRVEICEGLSEGDEVLLEP